MGQPPPETSYPGGAPWDRGCGEYKGEGPSTQALGAGFPRLSATRGYLSISTVGT
jgi:hypothetical protein